ncbi:hypothetical protein CCACVL1_05898 [Corchorus capsularis]|uniref:Uncharacterized protein n=1 Tax=Corchorus capsularis TaxID=210143 RepID=A0A1R3JIE7_COCAP|nr:hypothetical protein CCACVL1_05898 [Corchorus capsularis]
MKSNKRSDRGTHGETSPRQQGSQAAAGLTKNQRPV